jgi:sulfate permease, SulP family
MPAMAAIIMVVGANTINWEDVKPHFKDRKETVVFLASFLSVLFLDLFGAVIVGSVLAILYSKWEQAHPNISVRDNVLKIRGNIYYGSLPVIEAMYHQVIQRKGSVVLDISDCYYIDNEGIRWIAAAKASQKAALADRRRGDRRERAGGGDKSGSADKAGGKRRDRPDRRRRSEF